MNSKRKYFRFGIAQLEEEFEGAQDNIGILEELEEELAHRKTQRAKKLGIKVQSSLKSFNQSNDCKKSEVNTQVSLQKNKETHERIDPLSDPFSKVSLEKTENKINWRSVLKNLSSPSPTITEHSNESFLNNPLDILRAWTSVEVFSPQTYKRPQDMQGAGSVAYFKDGEPWFRKEKSRPHCNLYYIVHLGAIELEKATKKLISIFEDRRTERPATYGKASLGAILVNKKGTPVAESGVAISSFGWAYGQAIEGNINQIKHWELAENILLKSLEKMVYLKDEDDKDVPLDEEKIKSISKWLIHNCNIPEEDTEKPIFAIRLYQPFSKGDPEIPLLNSFYLSDLQWASSKIQKGEINHALSQYLGITKPLKQIDVLHDKSYLEDILQPKHTPLGRWPSRGRFPLVLLQQAAVNFASRELGKEGLISVNGPPGTGKTTLLRDIVARNIVERARALSKFENVNDAFSHFGSMKLGKGHIHFYQLSDAIRGYEMLVASSNNKAVENISKELPLLSQVADDLNDFTYFKTISDALAGDNEDTWGMIAAVLGNATNRKDFADKAWWDKSGGLQVYLKAIAGQISHNPNDHDNGVLPRIIGECDAPSSQFEAEQRWTAMRGEFDQVLAKSIENTDLVQKAYESYKLALDIKIELNSIASKIEKQNALIEEIKFDLELKLNDFQQAEIELNQVIDEVKELKLSRPGFISWLFRKPIWLKWKQQFQELNEIKRNNDYAYKNANDSYQTALANSEEALERCDELYNQKNKLEEQYQQAMNMVQSAAHLCEGRLVTNELWDSSHKEQQLFAPSLLKEAHYVRDDLFAAAMKLHKAFIDAAAKQIRHNLSAFFLILGKGLLPEEKRKIVPHLWSTAFLLTPVMSTTFASVDRMLENIGVGSLGWLLIDEAGQAIPQAAVGAIMRSKRVMVVGDPMQIEPVVSLPLPLVESILKHYKVDPYKWGAPYSSVQACSDEANPVGASMPRDFGEIRIGVPLLVHRRCEDPMFKISNQLAYDNQMVSATQAKESALTAVLGESCWFDIAGSANEKWCPEEGEFVANMISKAVKELGNKLDLFIITPFKIVEQNMRRRMEKEKSLLEKYGIENPSWWITNNIGTVHTFQGKEAQGVVLLLGATDPKQIGARRWATTNVNLLNVAVSRAKQNFYVVGNHNLWSEMGNMKIISQYLACKGNHIH